jgi:hypothetical protein
VSERPALQTNEVRRKRWLSRFVPPSTTPQHDGHFSAELAEAFAVACAESTGDGKVTVLRLVTR